MVKRQMMKWASERDGKDLEHWDQALPQFLVAINNRHVSIVECSPAVAMLGYQPFAYHEEMEDLEEDGRLEQTDLDRNVQLWRAEQWETIREEVRALSARRADERSVTDDRDIQMNEWVLEKLNKPGKNKSKFK
jgi:hypothetical protein